MGEVSISDFAAATRNLYRLGYIVPTRATPYTGTRSNTLEVLPKNTFKEGNSFHFEIDATQGAVLLQTIFLTILCSIKRKTTDAPVECRRVIQ